MINLITGMPGNGKTLFTIWEVEKMRQDAIVESEKTGFPLREVYYHGISNLNLPWIEFDKPEEWYKLPHGSIIVIDEAQRIFRARFSGSKVPEHVSQLETHRHNGFDLFLITQQPGLVETNVRKLIGMHRHIVRKFGMQQATIHRWDNEVRENCDKRGSRKDSIKTSWKFPKEVFAWYKSAEIHTMKRSIPMRVYFLFIAPLLIAICIYFFYRYVHKQTHPEALQGQTTGSSSAMVPTRLLSYVEAHTPEIQGLPFTAPAYREIMKPSIAPKPVACVRSPTRCDCYTQQATKIPSMPLATCISIVENGYFDEAPDKQDNNRIDWDRQNRNGALLQAKNEPSRVGAGQPDEERGSLAIIGSQPTTGIASQAPASTSDQQPQRTAAPKPR